MKMQALVMGMADDYIAALGEAVYLVVRGGKTDPKGRWLAQSFLRNGVGASLDIAVGPNPAVNLLDLMVLSSLQTWSFHKHWVPAGIGDAGLPALERLNRAEAALWTSAGKILSQDQLHLVRGLIDAWIVENAERTVVALVRFKEFGDERRMSSTALRGKATGLLKEVNEAIAVVDDTRMLGERLLWFAGRYPYLLGEQTELTAYRLIDQPEGAQLIEAIGSLQKLSEALTQRIETIQGDFQKERTAAIDQFQGALQTTTKEMLDRATESISAQRSAAIAQLFDRLAQERTLVLDDIASRKEQLINVMNEIIETLSASDKLARDLTETVNAVDRVVSRFDTDPNENKEPLRMADVRDAAIETGRAADRITLLLERTIELMESKAFDQKISKLSRPTDALIEKLFWRGAILIGLLIVGLGLLRCLLPPRVRNAP